MNKVLFIVMLVCSAFLVTGCTSTNTVQEVEKETIATTFFVTDEITKQIVGDKLNVELIIPKEISPHDYEPTPQQLVKLSKANTLVTLGGMFEHIEDEIVEVNSNIKIIESTHNIKLLTEEEGEHHHEEHSENEHHDEEHDEHSDETKENEHHEDEHEEHSEDEHHEEESHHDHHHEDFGYDPHVWLSVSNAILMTQEIEEHLVELYPEYAEEFKVNAQKYIQELEALQTKYNTNLQSCEADVIIVNHKAFGYIANEFGFEQVSAAGFSHEIEPSIKELEEIIFEAKEHNVSVIFSEGGVNPKLAETIATEVNGQVLPLYPIATTQEDSYISIMNSNLDNLKVGLKCN